MLTLLISSVTAALVSSGFLVWDYRRRRVRARKALLMAYVTELVQLFWRTVLYYSQRIQHGVSYSALYEVSEADMLGQFAGVVDDPKVIYAIIRLKERYFQIQRHVLEASKLATEFSIQEVRYQRLLEHYDPEDDRVKEAQNRSQDAIVRAKHAQSRALAFFEFDEMVDWTRTVIDYAKTEINTTQIYELEKMFFQKIKEKYQADLEQKKRSQDDVDLTAST